MAIFKGKLTQNGTDDAVINPLTNGFPNDLTAANLTLTRQAAGTYDISLALASLLNDNNAISFIQCDAQYNAGVCYLNDIGQLIHEDVYGTLCDNFAASVYIETVNQ